MINILCLQNLNVSSEDLNDFFGGPAFLAWARMGNLHAYVNLGAALLLPFPSAAKHIYRIVSIHII